MSFFDDKSVLVTGAGGTIGSEICRHLLRYYKPRKLYLVDNSEIALYQIERELTTRDPKPLIIPKLVDVSNRNDVFTHLPKDVDVVYHAAAYKHVRMCELNQAAAYRVNVLGTENVVDWAASREVPRLIFVSTDKAVRPTCTMGRTKRVAEAIALQKNYTVVRLGNVAGSSGSVIPLWEEQIKADKPVTITDGRATRYFITPGHAALLLLNAAAVAVGGETLVVDMGAPVRIFDLARDLGAQRFDFIGLQPGEKVHEELFAGTGKKIPGVYGLLKDVA